jgi:outer membrane lipoprotein-sorting protein
LALNCRVAKRRAGALYRYIRGIGDGHAHPRQIAISRPSDDYQLQIEIKKLTINEPISAERFVLAQPPGTKLIHPDESTTEAPKP